MKWRPIETAPKDAAVLLAAWVSNGPYYVREVGWWEEDEQYPEGGYWSFPSEGIPTHWMPLEEPPAPPA